MYSKFYTSLFCQYIAIITCCLMGIEIVRGATIYDQYLYQIPPLNQSRVVDDVFRNGFMATTPSETNVTDLRPDKPTTDNLFMLNTEVLFDRDPEASANTMDGGASPGENIEIGSKGGFRESRRINFFRGLWNKPKISPLYLVNGTVCRFVNSAPICTTLTTTGLLPTGTNSTNPSTSAQTEGGSPAVLFPFNNQQFTNNNNQQPPPRPSPILEDDSQDINVDSSNVKATENSTSTSSSTVRNQQQLQQTMRPINTSNMIQGSSRPINLASNRRPMNRLSLRRPMRQFYLNGG